MEPRTRYCGQCGEPFDELIDSQHCPRCGDTLLTWSGGPTIDLSTPAYVPQNASSKAADDRLIGAEFDHYRIESFLGRGGMARVYLATHLPLQRSCAIKLMHSNVRTESGNAVESLLAEARAAAALTHPNVVTIHTIGEDRGRHFIDMEYVDGESLARFIHSRAPIDPIQAAQIMVHVSSALSSAHELGMIHRDIKPGNVMVTRRGAAKLADFGLAKRVSSQSVGTSLTGTPNFMAPELFKGGEANERTDVYAMGVTYFCLIAGHLPFQGQTLNEIMRMHISDRAPDIRCIRDAVSNEVADVIEQCLAKSPHDRFRDAAELFGELKAVYGSLRCLEDLLNEALSLDSVTIEGADDAFEITVSLGDARTQLVHVELLRSSALEKQIIRIYSVCAPIDSQYFQRALELNARIPHGSIGIDTVAGKPHFVMANAYPRSTCDPEEIRQSVMSIANHADSIEQVLTGQDQH